MQAWKRYKKQGNEKVRMLALFNILTEEDKDFVISLSTSLVRKYGIFLKAKMHKTGQKKT
jgi:hypothetical protein